MSANTPYTYTPLVAEDPTKAPTPTAVAVAPTQQLSYQAGPVTGYQYYQPPAGYGSVPQPQYQGQVQVQYPGQVVIGQPIVYTEVHHRHHCDDVEDVCGVKGRDQACCAWALCITGWFFWFPWLFGIACIRSQVQSARIAGIISLIFILLSVVTIPLTLWRLGIFAGQVH